MIMQLYVMFRPGWDLNSFIQSVFFLQHPQILPLTQLQSFSFLSLHVYFFFSLFFLELRTLLPDLPQIFDSLVTAFFIPSYTPGFCAEKKNELQINHVISFRVSFFHTFNVTWQPAKFKQMNKQRHFRQKRKILL